MEERIKCITFDKVAQDALPEHIKAKMKADRERAREKDCLRKLNNMKLKEIPDLKYDISKPKVEHYKLRLPGTSMYWANIFIEDVGHGGRLIITSDYGTWSNFWDGIGAKTFKEFLIYLTSLNDIDYVANKLQARINGNPSPQFIRFWEEVWPDFIEVLKIEIS